MIRYTLGTKTFGSNWHILSGITYQLGGLQAALYASAGMLLIAAILTIIMASSLRRLEG